MHKKTAARRNIPPRQRLPLACPASSRTKGVLPDNAVSKQRYLQSADVSWSKVAVKSRRHRRSGLKSSTEGESADLTRDCPRDAAALYSRSPPPNTNKKNSGIVLLSHSQIYSTIAAGALNHRVREGNVCFCSAIDTGIYIPIQKARLKNLLEKSYFIKQP